MSNHEATIRVNVDQLSVPEGVSYIDPEGNACYSATVAYLMYRIGAPADLWHVPAIDNITGRSEGELTEDTSKATIALLKNGAEVVEIREFDYRRYITEGRSYAEEYHAEGWRKEDREGFDRYWTEERLAKDVAACALYAEQTEPFKDQLTEVFRRPSLADVDDLMDKDYMVSMAVRGISSNSCHQVVTVGREYNSKAEEDVYTWFDNNKLPRPFARWPRQIVEHILLPDNGIVAVRKAGE